MFKLVIVVALISTVIVGTVLGRRYRVNPPILLLCLTICRVDPYRLVVFGSTRRWCCYSCQLYFILGKHEHELSLGPCDLHVIAFLNVAPVIATAVAITWTA